MLNPYSLLVAQIIAHLSIIPMIAYGEMSHWLVSLVVYFFNGCIGMTVTYHRLLSHKSWEAPKWMEYFGVLCATVGLTGSALSWVAIHRKHHLFTDTENDPHSPSVKGFVYCQWFSMFGKVELRYIPDLLKQKFYIFQHRHYFSINFLYGSILLFFWGPMALVYAWLFPACLLWNAGSSIVTFSHLFGSNQHNLNNMSRNNWILALLVWGEGWHNNHHKFPNKKSFSQKKWQIDVGAYFIYVFEAIHQRLIYLLKLKVDKKTHHL